MSFKISLAGDLGSGKSTASKILMARTGAEYYSTGTICRREAAKHGMTIDEFNRYMESHPEVDKMIDDSLIALSDDPRTLVIDSRMAFHFVKGTFRVYLTTEARTSAERILGDKRVGESFDTVEETAKRVAARRQSENLRYFEKYGVHIMDMMNYDLVLDTTAIAPDLVAELILTSLQQWQNEEGYRACYLDYRRFLSCDTVTEERKAAIQQAIAERKPFPTPTVMEADGAYYVMSGLDAVIACKLRGEPIVPVTLLAGRPEHIEQYHPTFG